MKKGKNILPGWATTQDLDGLTAFMDEHELHDEFFACVKAIKYGFKDDCSAIIEIVDYSDADKHIVFSVISKHEDMVNRIRKSNRTIFALVPADKLKYFVVTF